MKRDGSDDDAAEPQNDAGQSKRLGGKRRGESEKKRERDAKKDCKPGEGCYPAVHGKLACSRQRQQAPDRQRQSAQRRAQPGGKAQRFMREGWC
ncbi:hypothetical protein [Sphingomonas sp. CCH5-D11]|uniref:hypothetical protein n=1 Tax=Sphingomonas sp. CCH5-D11 TaxID=1768786 RepID=UPI003FA7DE4A